MKLNLPSVLMIFAGTTLIYSAYIDKDPRDVIFDALNIDRRTTPKPLPDVVVTPRPIVEPDNRSDPVVSV